MHVKNTLKIFSGLKAFGHVGDFMYRSLGEKHFDSKLTLLHSKRLRIDQIFYRAQSNKRIGRITA